MTWGEYIPYYNLSKTFRTFKSVNLRKVTDENRADAVTAPTVIYAPDLRFPDVKKAEIPEHPAVSMTQLAARQYTKWLSLLSNDFYRLPSEAEWEHACRAGAKTAYSFGDNSKRLEDHGWFFENAASRTHPVGKKKPNAWGLYDMLGNASEWVLDQYDPKGYAKLRVLSAAGRQPILWPTKEYPRVVRGGSWQSNRHECRCSSRLGSTVDWKDEDPSLPQSTHWLAGSNMQQTIGFRIVRPLRTPAANEKSRYWDPDVPEVVEAVKTRIEEGRGIEGLVDPGLPELIQRLPKR